jgi:hypothetical protein
MPLSQTEDAGQPISIAAIVTNPGSGSDTYQWYNGSTPIKGATTLAYSAKAGAVGTFNYHISVTDSNHGVGTSNTGIVAVTALPSVSITPSSQTVDVGQTIILNSIIANPGSGGDTYQWYNNTKVIAGKTGATYTATAGAIGVFSYHAVVTDSNHGTGISNNALVTVCASPNKPVTLTISASGKSQVVQITNQTQVSITGSSDNVIVDANGDCPLAVTLTGSSDRLNLYNGTVNLTETGSSDISTLYGTVVSKQTITGSSDKVTGAVLNGNTFTLTGSNLAESVQVENLSSLILAGSSANITINMSTTRLMATNITGSSSIFHIANGIISLRITGSSNNFYYHNTTITSQSITGSGDKLIKD